MWLYQCFLNGDIPFMSLKTYSTQVKICNKKRKIHFPIDPRLKSGEGLTVFIPHLVGSVIATGTIINISGFLMGNKILRY